MVELEHWQKFIQNVLLESQHSVVLKTVKTCSYHYKYKYILQSASNNQRFSDCQCKVFIVGNVICIDLPKKDKSSVQYLHYLIGRLSFRFCDRQSNRSLSLAWLHFTWYTCQFHPIDTDSAVVFCCHFCLAGKYSLFWTLFLFLLVFKFF